MGDDGHKVDAEVVQQRRYNLQPPPNPTVGVDLGSAAETRPVDVDDPYAAFRGETVLGDMEISTGRGLDKYTYSRVRVGNVESLKRLGLDPGGTSLPKRGPQNSITFSRLPLP